MCVCVCVCAGVCVRVCVGWGWWMCVECVDTHTHHGLWCACGSMSVYSREHECVFSVSYTHSVTHTHATTYVKTGVDISKITWCIVAKPKRRILKIWTLSSFWICLCVFVFVRLYVCICLVDILKVILQAIHYGNWLQSTLENNF